MNFALFRSMLKFNLKSMLSYGIGMTFYLWLVTWMYPSIGQSPSLNSLLKTMPPALLKFVGYQTGISHVSDFLAGEFYGMIYVIILTIYTVMTATKLMAHLVENGSMAYLLATPVSRIKVAITQSVVLAVGICVIGLFSTLGGILGVRLLVPAGGLDTRFFVEMNVVGALLFLLIGAYSFLFSCIARDERQALSMSAVLTLIFYALHTGGTISDKFAWLNNLSVFTAFNASELIHGTAPFATTVAALSVSSIVLFAIAILGFRKRQMSL